MSFNINEFEVSKGTGSKILEPGTHLCRVVDIEASATPYDINKIQITFKLEGEPESGDFVGVAIDKNNPSLGNYEGKVGFVKNGQYAFNDWVNNGELTTADTNACNFLARFSNSLGVFDEMKKDPALQQNVNIYDFVAVAKKYICDPDLWAYYTIGGKEKWVEGYNNPNYYLHFVKYENRKNFVSLEEDKVVPFNPDDHIIKTDKGIPVTSTIQNNTIIDINDVPTPTNIDPFAVDDPFADDSLL